MLNVFRENMKNFDFSRCATNFHFRSVLVDVLSFSFQSIYVMKFFFCLHTAAIAIVIVVSKLECKVITYFIPSVGGDLNFVGKFFSRKQDQKPENIP